VGDRIDHGRDRALGAEIEHAADEREIVQRDAHDRRGAGRAHRADRLRGGREVELAVLVVEIDGGKAVARQDFCDEGRGEPAPAEIDGFTGAQPPRERKA
jgi:hypothetical protein